MQPATKTLSAAMAGGRVEHLHQDILAPLQVAAELLPAAWPRPESSATTTTTTNYNIHNTLTLRNWNTDIKE